MDRLVIPAPGIRVGFWKITESPETLAQMYNGGAEYNTIQAMVPSRQVHALSGRLLGQHFYPEHSISKDENGKPFLVDHNDHISWSHSGNYAAFISSESMPVGIDIEMVSNRIRRIEDKFCNETDKNNIHISYHTESLLLIWAAKESMYKVYGKKEVDFKKDMTVDSFEVHHRGRFQARFHKGKASEQFVMEYEFFDGHVAVWTLGTTEKSK